MQCSRLVSGHATDSEGKVVLRSFCVVVPHTRLSSAARGGGGAAAAGAAGALFGPPEGVGLGWVGLAEYEIHWHSLSRGRRGCRLSCPTCNGGILRSGKSLVLGVSPWAVDRLDPGKALPVSRHIQFEIHIC